MLMTSRSDPAEATIDPRTKSGGSTRGRSLATAVHVAALLPAIALAQPLEQSGRWAVSGPWGHQAIHLALLRGDGTQHSKIVSFAFGWPAKLYGWNPANSPGAASCATFPDEQFQMVSLDSNVAGIDPAAWND